MEKTFFLGIVTPTRKFFEEQVEMVIVKTPNGELGVLPGHIPCVAALEVGPVKIKRNGEWIEAVLSEGFMEITQRRSLIMADSAEWPDEIDENRANEAKQRAEERLQRQISRIEYVQSKAALARAMARLKVKSK